MKKTLSILIALVGVVIWTTACQGQTVSNQGQTASGSQAKPNFAGTWKLNLDKSDFGQGPQPTSQTEVITQTGDDLKISMTSESDQGSWSYAFSLTVDGTEKPFPKDALPADSPFQILSSKGEWQGSSLVITQKTNFQDSPGTVKSTYTLSPDGKVLTKSIQISGERGEFDIKSVFDKA